TPTLRLALLSPFVVSDLSLVADLAARAVQRFVRTLVQHRMEGAYRDGDMDIVTAAARHLDERVELYLNQ
ncbi:MAG: hypothetical protein OEN20_05310, partial [Gammaproteobacteria bacterium]|nr:hypothetical protein [Gammaproteobacteria bacterium]